MQEPWVNCIPGELMPDRFEIKAGRWYCWPAQRDDKVANVRVNSVICKPMGRDYPYFQFINDAVFIHNLNKDTIVHPVRIMKGIYGNDVEVQVVALKPGELK